MLSWGALFFAAGAAVLPDQLVAGNISATHEAMIQIVNRYGALNLLLLVAVAGPIVEETVFRGILLQGFARHVSFTASNWIQAIIFASLHENLMLFPLFVAFAFVAAKAAQRSGGLLTSIVAHMVFNGIAALTVIATLN